MAITTMDGLLAGISSASNVNFMKVSAAAEGAGTYHSLFKVAGFPIAGANPPTGVGDIPTSATVGAIPFTNPGGANTKYFGRVEMVSSTIGTLIIYDRLWHNSGWVGNIATSQTVNSKALTRNTSGVGVEIFGEVYTAMGATASTFSVTYTDSTNTSRVGTYAQPANALSVGQMFYFNPPIAGNGCKSIQSVILSISTGTAGNFGLTMVKRVAEIPLTLANVSYVMDSFALGMPTLEDNSCLCAMVACTTTATGNIFGSLKLIEG